jgi:hypothetical protein
MIVAVELAASPANGIAERNSQRDGRHRTPIGQGLVGFQLYTRWRLVLAPAGGQR